MSNIFPPNLVKHLREKYDFEESPYFDSNRILKKALIIVDLQNDFLPGGALEVHDGDIIIPYINTLQSHFDLVIATQDWHPANHKSFASNHNNRQTMEIIDLHGQEQVLWPDHCVQGTKGAQLADNLHQHGIELIVRKGMETEIDSYSAFFDNGRKKTTGLAGYLIEKNVGKVSVCGLAADFCVYYTAIDALDLGFEVEILLDGTQPIDPHEFSKKIDNFQNKGGTVSSNK